MFNIESWRIHHSMLNKQNSVCSTMYIVCDVFIASFTYIESVGLFDKFCLKPYNIISILFIQHKYRNKYNI